MPCYCWYDPPEEAKRHIKFLCQQLIEEIKELDKEGDACGCTFREVKELLEHLYYPEMCKEKPSVGK